VRSYHHLGGKNGGKNFSEWGKGKSFRGKKSKGEENRKKGGGGRLGNTSEGEEAPSRTIKKTDNRDQQRGEERGTVGELCVGGISLKGEDAGGTAKLDASGKKERAERWKG